MHSRSGKFVTSPDAILKSEQPISERIFTLSMEKGDTKKPILTLRENSINAIHCSFVKDVLKKYSNLFSPLNKMEKGLTSMFRDLEYDVET